MSWETRLTSLGLRVPVPVTALALGLLSWCASVLLPSIHRASALSPQAFAWALLPPLTLGWGLWLARGRRAVAPYALLSAFPLSLAVCVSRFDHDTALATFSPHVLGFSLLSLAGYACAASSLCARPAAVRAVDHRPLGEVAPIDVERRKHVLGTLVLSAVAAGALLLVCWSSWATPAHYREQWGLAAPEGATLTALVAGIVGALSLSLVGPALRAERGQARPREQRKRRVTWLLLVAASGVVVYAVLRGR